MKTPNPPESGKKQHKLHKELEELPSLSQSLALEESDPPRKSQLAIFSIISFLVLFVIWAALTPIDEVAVGEGEIIPEGFVKTIQHLEGGIIQEIKVQDGDIVKENQLLIKLQPEQALADLDQIRMRQLSLMVKAERLRAIGMGDRPHFERFADAYLKEMIKGQRDIYSIKMRDYTNQVEIINKQIAQQKARITVQNGQSKDLQERIIVLKDQRDLVKSLLDKQLQTRTNLYLIEDRLGEVRQEHNQTINEMQQTAQAIAESEGRRTALESKLRNEALDELGKVTAEMLEVEEMKIKLDDRVRRLEIRAPTRGVVKGLKSHTLQGVIPAGAQIMEIVPIENMTVEAKIAPKDIGNLREGQPTTIKVTAYDYSRYGVVLGTVKSISASSFVDETKKESYFKIYVSMDKLHVGNKPEVNRVSPGMTAIVEVTTGQKHLLDYLVKPIYNVYTSAFKER